MRGGSWANSNFLRAVPETMESMMWFLALGLLLMLLKWLEFGPVAEWAWWQTMIPLGLMLIPFIESVIRIFDRYGERAKRMKARMKFLVKDLGLDVFLDLVKEEEKSLPFKTYPVDYKSYE